MEAAPEKSDRARADWSDLSYYLVMRDGVRLALSFYFPDHVPPSPPAPIVLVQTRYGRAGARHAGNNNPRSLDPWLSSGYVGAIVDVRGSAASFGDRACELGPDEQADMDEIIRHLAALPWSNGKVIATGVSYTANTADMATTRPAPALIGAIPRATDFDYWEIFWPGGVPNDALFKDWAEAVHDLDFGRCRILFEPGPFDGSANIKDIGHLFPAIQPVDDDAEHRLVHNALSTREVGRRHWTADVYADVSFRDDVGGNGHSFFDSGAAAHMDAVRREKKPVQYWASWLDANTGDEAINRFRSAPDVPGMVIITPNDHGGGVCADPFFPDRTEPFPPLDEQHEMRLAFAADLLSGKPPARLIRYYVLGSGSFRETLDWPPAGIAQIDFHLERNGRLTRDVPQDGVESYEIDFTATTGRANRWYQFLRAAYPDRSEQDAKLLVYETTPFAADMELAGWPVVTLRMSATSTDPAIFAYLEDVAPDGTITYVTEGQIRAVNRKIADIRTLPYDPGPAPHSFRRSDALAIVPREKFEIAFKLYAVAALIKRGHRLRLAIAGADADTFRRLTDAASERFEIYRGASDRSRLTLPLRVWKENNPDELPRRPSP